MATIETSCPHCGATITIDDDWESAFCSYCGNVVEINPTAKIDLNTESTIEPNTAVASQPITQTPKSVVLKRPGKASLIIGIILVILNIGICINGNPGVASIVLLVVGVLLIGLYVYRSIRYSKNLQQAMQNGYDIKNE